MTKSKYHTIRKVSWDALWHGLYTKSNGNRCWDRLTQAQALKEAKSLIYDEIDNETFNVLNKKIKK
jgi:hypothetical protein